MSLTPAEREKMKLEITQGVGQGWQEDTLARLKTIRAANPGMDYDAVWNEAKRQQRDSAIEPKSMSEATKLVQAEHPSMSFEQAWDFAEATYPKLVRGHSAGEPLTRDRRISQEMGRITNLNPASKKASIGDHVERLAKIRKLMREQNLTFEEAFDTVIKQEHGLTANASLVTCQAAIPIGSDAPPWIQYLPKGRSTICPSVDGEAKTVSVEVDPSVATKLQSDLERLQRENRKPFLCFDHQERQAAAFPTRFRWDPALGVVLDLDWTASGRAAVSGHDYGWISPSFMLNSKTGLIAGLPPGGGSIGSLTNRPAFTGIRRLQT